MLNNSRQIYIFIPCTKLLQLLFPTGISFFIDKLHGSASLFCNQLTSCVLSFSDKINNLIAPLQNMINNPKLSVAAMVNEFYLLVLLPSLTFYAEQQTGVTNVLEVTRCTGSLHDIYPLFPFINYQLFSMFIVLNLSTKFLTSGYHFMQETTVIFYRLT